MKIHEYQAAELFKAYGVRVPEGKAAATAQEAGEAARSLGAGPYVIKAQVHSGGRGKAGGVKFAQAPEEAEAKAGEILGMKLVTKQTGPEGRIVKRVLVSRAVEIAREYYVSLTVDGARERVVMIASSAGGMEIEETAKEAPEKIYTMEIDPYLGLTGYQAREMGKKLGLGAAETKQFIALSKGLYRLFVEKDCSLLDLRPAQAEPSAHFPRLIAGEAEVGVDLQGAYFFRRFPCRFLDLHAAGRGGDHHHALARAVHGEGKIVFAGDLHGAADERFAHHAALRAGLLCHQRHAEDLFGPARRFGGRLREFYAAGLAAAAGVHLRLDHKGAVPQRARRRFRLRGRGDRPALRHAHAIGLKKRRRLVFVYLHCVLLTAGLRSTLPTRPASCPRKGRAY